MPKAWGTANLDLKEEGPEVKDGGVVVEHLPLHLHKGLAQHWLRHSLALLHCCCGLGSGCPSCTMPHHTHFGVWEGGEGGAMRGGEGEREGHALPFAV